MDLIVFSDLADESQKRFQDENPKADEEDIDQLPLYDLDTIVSATDSFSFQNKIGEGGFGVVYKVVFLYICRTVKKKVLLFMCFLPILVDFLPHLSIS